MGRQGIIIRTMAMTSIGGIAARDLPEGLVMSFVAHGQSRTAKGLLLGLQGIIIRTMAMTSVGGIAARDLPEGLVMSFVAHGQSRTAEGLQGIIIRTMAMMSDGGIAAWDLSKGLVMSLCGCLRGTSFHRILRLVLPLGLGGSIDNMCHEDMPL